MQYLKRVHLYINKRNGRFNNSSETWHRNKFHYTATSDIPLLSARVLNIQHMWFVIADAVAYLGIFFGGGGSTNSVEDRENGDLGAVVP
jgi:hypothetical protein